MTIHVSTELLKDWNPRYSFIVKLAGRTGIEVTDFVRGIETGDFVRKDRKDYIGAYTTKDDLRDFLLPMGFESDRFLESDSMGTLLKLRSYAEKLGLEISEMLEEAGASALLKDRRFTEVVTDPEDPGYYSTALDGLVLPFLYMLQAIDRPVSYLDTGYGKGGWNPTIGTLCQISEASGIDLASLVSSAKSGGDIFLEPHNGSEGAAVTVDDVRRELVLLLGDKPLRQLSKELGINQGKLYQDLRRRRTSSITILSLLPYLERCGMTLPEFFGKLCGRKGADVV